METVYNNLVKLLLKVIGNRGRVDYGIYATFFVRKEEFKNECKNRN